MANIIDAWKKLGKKLTGQDITGTNLVNVIDNIADNYEGGGGGNVIQLVLKYQYSNNTYTFPEPSPMSSNEIVEALASGAMVDVYWASVNDVEPYVVKHSSITQTVDPGFGLKENWYVLVENVDPSSDFDCAISGTNISVFD